MKAALRLLPWTEAQRDFWRRLNGDTRVVRWIGSGPTDPHAIEALFDKVLALHTQPDPRFHGLWCVWEGETQVGMAERKHTGHTRDGEAELIYALVPEAWGRGLGGALVRTLQDEARARGLDALATVHPDNAASVRVLAREGFAPDPPLPDGTLVLRWTWR